MGTSLVVKAPDVQFQLSDDTFSIKDLKTSVSDRKAAIASAITDKGVSTSPTAAFSTMAQNIRSIQSGGPSRTCSIKIVNTPAVSVYFIYLGTNITNTDDTLLFTYVKSGSTETINAVLKDKTNIWVFRTDVNTSNVFSIDCSNTDMKRNANMGSYDQLFYAWNSIPSR